MAEMWYMEKTETNRIAKAVVFNESTMREFEEDGYNVAGKYTIRLIEGDDSLPEVVEEA